MYKIYCQHKKSKESKSMMKYREVYQGKKWDSKMK
jgi:hypothetical protein